MTENQNAIQRQSIEVPPVALTGPVLSPVNVARLGSQMRGVGLNDDDVAALIGTVQEVARQAAEEAACRTTLAIMPKLLEFVTDIHRSAALRIAGRLQAQPVAVWTRHENCVNVAMGVASEPARRYQP
jgi:hypothetical protein